MKVNIDVNKTQLRDIIRAFNGIEDSIKKGLLKAMLHVEGKVKSRFGTAGNLQVRTGNLRRSITSGIKGLEGWVGTDVKYAPIHEYGGTIRARNKPYLKFQIAGQWKTVKQVVIPARPFLRPTLDEESDKVVEVILNHILEEFGK